MNTSDKIKIAAALTAAPRWVIALMPADGAKFPWADSIWWQVGSALLSLAFAVVEVYATAYMMKAWREAKVPKQQKIMGALWIGSLVTFVIVLAPPLYVNVMRSEMSLLPWYVTTLWLMCVAMCTFLIIGGVGYADRTKDPQREPVQTTPKKEVVTEQSSPEADSKPVKAKPFNSYKEFEAHVLSLNGTSSHVGAEIANKLIADGQPKSTAYNWVNLLSERHQEYSPVKS